MLPFPSAATLWLFLLLLLAVYSHVLMIRIAGYNDWKTVALTLPVTLTFGPLFLNVTLGQNGIVLLLSALLLGEILRGGSKGFQISAVAMWVVAVAAKVYPVLWVGSLLLARRWRTFAVAISLCFVAFGMMALLEPEISADYWFDFLPGRTRQFATGVSIDDQSLNGFLSRVGTSNSYTFPGLNIQDRHEVTWSWPWDFSAQSIRYFSSVLLLILGALLMFCWIQNNAKEPEGILYSLVLFSLLLFPNMGRYNHVLALPAMAWLWKQKTPYRKLTVIAYGLFALSRLNHLWALFPSPIGPLASGFGLFGVLIVILGLSYSLSHLKGTSQTDQVE
ncbi:MAG: glycosyltransferase 87 family protein [Chloroflexota bacterium]|nr:glycosyltransferase 87 family protein [Chloroflexota bacterium]